MPELMSGNAATALFDKIVADIGGEIEEEDSSEIVEESISDGNEIVEGSVGSGEVDAGGAEEKQEAEEEGTYDIINDPRVLALIQHNQTLQNQLNETQRALKAPETKTKSTDELIESLTFVNSRDELDDVLSSPEAANAFFRKLVTQAVATSREISLQELPTVIHNQQRVREEYQTKLIDWYGKNKHLVPFHAENTQLAVQIQGQNNDLTLDQVLEKVAEMQTARYQKVGIIPEKKTKLKEVAMAAPSGARRPSGAKVTEAEDMLERIYKTNKGMI